MRMLLLLSVPLFLLAQACGDSGDGPTEPEPSRATSLTLSVQSVSLQFFGETVDLDATVRDQRGQRMSGVSVLWSSSAPEVATVSSEGTVEAIGNGSATITASASGLSAEASATVHQRVDSVSVTPETHRMVSSGGQVQLTAAATDPGGSLAEREYDVAWSSSDANVAVVDTTGLVTAQGEGTAEITALVEEVTGSTSLDVVPGAVDTVRTTGETTIAAPSGASITIPEGALAGGTTVTVVDMSIAVEATGDELHGVRLEATDSLEATAFLELPAEGDPRGAFFGEWDPEEKTITWTPHQVNDQGNIEGELRHFSAWTFWRAGPLAPDRSYTVSSEGFSEAENADIAVAIESWKPYLEKAGIDLTFDPAASAAHIRIILGPLENNVAGEAEVDLDDVVDGQPVRLVILNESLPWHTGSEFARILGESQGVVVYDVVIQNTVQHEIGHLVGLRHPRQITCQGWLFLDEYFGHAIPSECRQPPVMAASSFGGQALAVREEDLRSLADVYEFALDPADTDLTVVPLEWATPRVVPGAVLDVGPEIEVTDGNGSPVPGVPVLFLHGETDGSVQYYAVSTNSQGQAGPGRWTVGQVGVSQVRAFIFGVTVEPFEASVLEPASLQVVDAELSAEPGSTVTVSARVLAGDGGPVQAAEVLFRVDSGNGSLGEGEELAVLTDAEGVASVEWSLPDVEGEYTLTVSAEYEGVALSGSPDTINASVLSGGTWSQISDLGGVARWEAVSFTIGNNAYVGTGRHDRYGVDSLDVLRDFWEYDPSNGSWTQKADFPSRTYRATSFAVLNRGYVLKAGTQEFWEYDPVGNIWSRRADFPGERRWDAVGFAAADKGYIHAGTGNWDPLDDLWEYDPTSNSWIQRASLRTSHKAGFSFVINDVAYIGAGYQTYLWEYDPQVDIWTQKAGLDARANAVAFSIGDRGYVGTGRLDGPLRDFWEYNPTTNSWVSKAVFEGEARDEAVGFSMNGRGYIGTGRILAAGGAFLDAVPLKDFWVYDP